MTNISDLPRDLLGDVLSRAPLTCLKTVRSTCKNWYYLSKNQILGKAAARKQFMGFMRIGYRVFSMEFDLQGIRNNDDFVDPSMKPISVFDQVKVSIVFHCYGLLLCIVGNHPNLLVWNPYLGESRCIQARNNSQASNSSIRVDKYTLGYDDNNHNHKILKFLVGYEYDASSRKNLLSLFEIYNLYSKSWKRCCCGASCKDFYSCCVTNMSWKVLDVTLEWDIWSDGCDNVSLKERFGPRLPLPFHSDSSAIDIVILSCVRDEQLAVLYQLNEPSDLIEIWITTKIEPNAVSWERYMKVNMTSLKGFPDEFYAGSFFIDKEKKLVVVFHVDGNKQTETCYYQTAYIIGEHGYFKYVNIKEAPNLGKPGEFNCTPGLALSYYVPSLVKPQIKQQGKRKERDN